MDLDIAEFCLKEAMKVADYADVRLEHSVANGAMLKNGIPELSGFDQASGIGLRIFIKDASGFAATNTLTKDSVKDLVRRSLKLTKAAMVLKGDERLSNEKTYRSNYEVKQKKNVEDADAGERFRILKECDYAATSTKAHVAARFFGLTDSVTEKYVATSSGTRIFSKIPRIDLSCLMTLQANSKLSQRYWQLGCSSGFEIMEKWKLEEKLPEEVKALDNNLRKGGKPPKGYADFVASPELTGIIVHESCGHPFEADRISGRESAQAGESYIKKDSMGTRAGSSHVTIVDEPSIEGSYGFYLFDDEGVPGQKKFLIKNGIAASFLHNRETAARMGIHSNGSARSSAYDREPIVRMSNTYIEPGTMSEEELIEGVKLGVYMKSYMEWNIDDTRSNQKYAGAESYLIKNGRIAGPVYKPTIEITTKRLYSSVTAVASNLDFHAGSCGKAEPMQPMPVWFGGPTIRISNVRFK